MDALTFGQNLKMLRIEKGFTQKELADDMEKKMAITVSTAGISQYENDKRIPEIDVLSKLATYFNVSIDFLLGKTSYRGSDIQLTEQIKQILLNQGIIQSEDEILSSEKTQELELLFKKVLEIYKLSKPDNGNTKTPR